MFVQVIQGNVADAEALRAALDRWQEQLAPGASGWLGSTGGVTADGRAIALVRFESAEAARRSSERPEQHQWWTETSKLFAGKVTFHDCREVHTFLAGGSDDAGFVQVIQGRSTDQARMRQVMEETGPKLHEYRPEIIGGVVAVHADGEGFTQAVYFTSEAAARAGEGKEPPAELAAMDKEISSMLSDATFYDLTQPALRSPR